MEAAAEIAMGSMICIWGVPVPELVMVTEEPMEPASKKARGESLHWLWVVPNVFGSEIQQGKPQTILGGWVELAVGAWRKEGAMSFMECMGYAQEEPVAALTLGLGWDLKVRRATERRYR